MKKIAAILFATAAIGLSACSSEPDETPAPENTLEPLNDTVEPLPEPTPSVTVAPTATPTPETMPDLRDDTAQMQDDADAVGMTARLPRDSDAPTNEQ